MRIVYTAARWLVLAALLTLYACALLFVQVARADRSAGDQLFVRVLARVSFGEGLDSYQDLALIHQVASGHGDTSTERARWLASHSRCHSGTDAPRSRRMTQDEARARHERRGGGNCVWVRNVTPSAHLPRGWPHSQAAWQRMRPRWLEHLDRTRAFVDGVDPYRPCMRTPTTWDGDHPAWRARARARGFVAVRCAVGASNVGYVRGSAGGA